jgi:hypothetical protein
MKIWVVIDDGGEMCDYCETEQELEEWKKRIKENKLEGYEIEEWEVEPILKNCKDEVGYFDIVKEKESGDYYCLASHGLEYPVLWMPEDEVAEWLLKRIKQKLDKEEFADYAFDLIISSLLPRLDARNLKSFTEELQNDLKEEVEE